MRMQKCSYCGQNHKCGHCELGHCDFHSPKGEVEVRNWSGSKYYPAIEPIASPNCKVSGCDFKGSDWKDLYAHLQSHIDEAKGGPDKSSLLEEEDKKQLEELFLSLSKPSAMAEPKEDIRPPVDKWNPEMWSISQQEKFLAAWQNHDKTSYQRCYDYWNGISLEMISNSANLPGHLTVFRKAFGYEVKGSKKGTEITDSEEHHQETQEHKHYFFGSGLFCKVCRTKKYSGLHHQE